MANYAVIEKGVVVNIAIWDGDVKSWNPPKGAITCLLKGEVPVRIGDRYDGEKFIATRESWEGG